MPRNEFMDHPEEDEQDHPGKGEVEDPDQEVLPFTDDDPHMWPAFKLRPSLVELRRASGLTTEAHIAEIKSKSSEEPATLFDD